MQFLSKSDMIALLPAEPHVESMGYHRLTPLLIAGGIERLQTLTDSGFLRTCQVNKGDKEQGLFWFRVEHERLIVDTIVGVGTDARPALDLIETMAKQFGCKEIEAASTRHEMLNYLCREGFQPEKVVVRKRI